MKSTRYEVNPSPREPRRKISPATWEPNLTSDIRIISSEVDFCQLKNLIPPTENMKLS
jgi:hypothetical protein